MSRTLTALVIAAALLPIGLGGVALLGVQRGEAGDEARSGEVQVAARSPTAELPAYDESGALLRPEGWEKWVVVGTSMGLSYSEGDPSRERGPDDPPGMFHNVLMPEWAYEGYRETGEFPDRTMLALAIYDVGTSAPPRERGFYQGELVALELHVKHAGRFPGGPWGFFNFGATGRRAELLPRQAACYSCHAEHAAQDDVFTQFYPLLGAGVDAPAVGPGAEGSG